MCTVGQIMVDIAIGFCRIRVHGPSMAAWGQSETKVTTEPWSAVEWIADADLSRASFYWDSVPHCRNPPSACQVRGRAIPCSDCAKQRHDIIPNRLALTAEESVSGVTGATAQVNQETPPMRIYIIGNAAIPLCREPPTTVNKGEVAVASREELHAARLSGKRLLALWNALPGVEKQTKVGDRDTLNRSAVVGDRSLAGPGPTVRHK